MKAKRLVPFVLALIALFTACDDDASIPVIESTDYFPLHIGDTWEYKDHIRKVCGSEIINKKEYRVITHEIYRADTLYYTYNTYFRTTRDNKVYQLNSDQSGEYLFADFNLSADESWTYINNSNGRDDEWTVTVLPEITFEFDDTELENCKRLFYNALLIVDEEHTIVFAAGIGEINSFSNAWGVSDTIQRATIDGVTYGFK